MNPGTRAPRHAKLFSFFVGLISLTGFLRFFHILPTRHPYTGGPEHLVFHQFLSLTEFTLGLLGAVLLWNMRPFATKVFAVNLAVSVGATIYLSLVVPDGQIILLRKTALFPLLWLIALGIPTVEFLYVRWVISRRAVDRKFESTRSDGFWDPDVVKFVSILYAVAACLRLLTFLHILPNKFGWIDYPEHPLLSRFAPLAGVAILLPASYFLWKLQPVAARLFLLYLLLTTSLTIYLTWISPDTQMLKVLPMVLLLRLATSAGVCLFAWSVTSPHRPSRISRMSTL